MNAKGLTAAAMVLGALGMAADLNPEPGRIIKVKPRHNRTGWVRLSQLYRRRRANKTARRSRVRNR